MNITVWNNFKKRKNSTLQPSATGTVISNVRLKDNCNYENPVFLLNQIDFDINYIQAFGKYYYVESIDILSADHAAYNCTMDLLSSYKADIQATSAFITRSASDYNKYLNDSSVATFSTVTQNVHDVYATPFNSDGCFILSVVNEIAGAGAVSHYAMDSANMQGFSNFMSNIDPNDPLLQNLIQWSLVNMGDIWSCVVDCKWIPVKYSSLGNVAQSIRIGSYNITNVLGILLNDISPITLTAGTSIDISDLVPDDFRRIEPYTSIELFVPMYGLIALPAGRCTNKMSLTVKLDPINGDVFAYIMSTGDNHTDMIMSLNYNVAVSIPVAQINAGKTLNIASSVMNIISGMAMSMGSKFAEGIAALGPAVLQNSPSVKSSIGGSAMADDVTFKIYVKTIDTVNPDDIRSRYGRPLCEVRTLSGLSGFTACSNASVSCDATNAQTSSINQMLNSGIFLE